MSPDFDELKRRLAHLGWYHSIEIPGRQPIIGLQSLEQLRERIAQFAIPQDLRGKRVLDVGAWDGWFSFEMERRGAKVVAIDNSERHRFGEAAKLLGSSVEHITADICGVSSRDLGYFEFVLFFGVLYHLKHPLLALENVCELTTEAAFVESYVCDGRSGPDLRPCMEFYENEELLGQLDNWVGPNIPCLLAMCRTAGFARAELQSVLADRAHVTCFRSWLPSVGEKLPDLVIISAENTLGNGTSFRGNQDEYVSIWFKSTNSFLKLNQVFPRIGLYGSKPVHLSKIGEGGYLLNCKLPPGLLFGKTTVSLETAHGISSNEAIIWVGDKPPAARGSSHVSGPPRVTTVADGLTWVRNQVTLTDNGGFLSLWVENIDEGLAASALRLASEHQIFSSSFISTRLPDGLIQINFPIPCNTPIGPMALRLIVDEDRSDRFDVLVVAGQ